MMMHTFKLAHRIGRPRLVREGPIAKRSGLCFSERVHSPAHAFAAAVLVTLATGCTDDNKLGDITSSSPSAQVVILTPDSFTLTVGSSKGFAAEVKLSDGAISTQSVTFKSTGGSIDGSGMYTAGDSAGTYKVVATLGSSGAADTATVMITAVSATCVSAATMLCPGDNIQAKAMAAGSGATLTLQPGVYRMQTVTPLANQTFQGQPGAVMSGARLLTGWRQSGTTWYVTGQTQMFPHTVGQCGSGTACLYPEDVYRDNVLLRRVLSISAMGPGKFYFDYAADRIYVGDNPAGHVIEGAATEYAFNGSPQGVGTGVKIRGLIIEKYANPAQSGAVGRSNMGANWILRDNEIRYNHGAGIRGGAGVVVAHNKIHHNGQIGLESYFARVDSNEIAYNNTAGFKVDWEAGGLKFSRVPNVVARGNWVHHNHGAGLWSDYENTNTTYDRNVVEDNEDVGILHEVSWSATITNNVVRRNGWRDPSPSEGAGIMIMSSGGTGIKISGNVLDGNKNGIMLIQSDRGRGSQGEFTTKNVSVYGNTVNMGSGQRTGAVRYGGNTGLWTTNNNHFERNIYNLRAADATPFQWVASNRTDSQWRAYGNDETGTWNR